jgi:FkbM family methyltransferase
MFWRKKKKNQQGDAAKQEIESMVPGWNDKAIRLSAYYAEFRDYYPNCEMQTKKWCVDNIGRDWHCLDIGANVGIYTSLFCQLCPTGKVWAFEPTETVEMLRENCREFTNLKVEPLAVGKKSGKRDDRIFRIWGKPPEIKSYPFTSVDDYVRRQNIGRLDLIKIDVDSFDFDVLQGSEKTLQDFNPWIIVELNHALAQRNQNNAEALEWLAKQGYKEALVLEHENFILRRGFEFSQITSICLKFPQVEKTGLSP